MQARKITITTPPVWLPSAFRNLPPAELQFRVRFTPAERQVYRKRLPILPSKWAERHRYVTSGPLEGGKWSNYLAPYLAGIMDASFFPSVRLIINCKAVQVGGTTGIETCLGYAIDRRPGPALVVYPDRDTARENNRDNLQPMIKSSPRLKSYLTGVDDDIATLRIKLTTMLLYMGWSGSATSLGNKSVKYLVLDEIDKYTETPNKKEAASIDLAEKRTTAYPHDYKEWKNSTPTIESGPIWQALTTEAQVIFEYWGKCPDCGAMQLVRFGGKDPSGALLPGGIRWPQGERDHEKIENESLAWYECENCLSHWSDHQRNWAVRHGEWRAKGDSVKSPDGGGRELFAYLKVCRPRKIGFHLPAWISPFVSLSKSAAAFVKGRKDKVALKDFLNNYAAEPWVTYEQERQEDKILALRDDRPRGMVPGNDQVICLIGCVDTQDHGYWYEIRAVGFGQESETWGVREGFVETTEALEKIMVDDTYLDASGVQYPVQFVLHDAMGHRTAEIYDLSAKYGSQFWMPLQGAERLQSPYSISNIEFYPGTKKPIPGGVRLLRINTTYYKDKLSSKLKIAKGDPGAWNFHADTTDEWAGHLCAEVVNDQGKWECLSSRANHGWDCSVYLLAAIDYLGIKYEVAEAPAESAKKSSTKTKSNSRRW